jgi:hypothetical protein
MYSTDKAGVQFPDSEITFCLLHRRRLLCWSFQRRSSSKKDLFGFYSNTAATLMNLSTQELVSARGPCTKTSFRSWKGCYAFAGFRTMRAYQRQLSFHPIISCIRSLALEALHLYGRAHARFYVLGLGPSLVVGSMSPALGRITANALAHSCYDHIAT